MHEIEAAHVGVGDGGARHRACIVDHDVEAAEARDRGIDGGLHLRLIAHIDNERQRLTACLRDLLRGGEDGAGELGMRLLGFGGDRDVGAVAGGAQRNGEPDPARCAGDEQRAAFQGHLKSRSQHVVMERGSATSAERHR